MKGFYGELGVRGLFLSVLLLHVNTTHNYVMVQAPQVRVGWATNSANQDVEHLRFVVKTV